jgi:thiamine monophosphate kinase
LSNTNKIEKWISDRCKEEDEEDSKQRQEQKVHAITMEHLHEQWMQEDRKRQRRAMEQGEEYNICVRYPEKNKETLEQHWAKEAVERRKRTLERGDEEE